MLREAVERIVVETELGPVWFWGVDRGRPILVAITGAFANASYLQGLARVFPGLDVFRLHLPGNHCPELSELSVAAWARAYDAALRVQFTDRPIVLHGVSVGALVAMAMRHPEISRLALVEPPLYTREIWPFLGYREGMPPGAGPFIREIFGLEGDRLVGRDYRPLLDNLRVDTSVLLAADPLEPPRRLDGRYLPSLVDIESRRLLEAHPMTEIAVAPETGHNILGQAQETYLHWLAASVEAAFGDAASRAV